ncbi:MAG: TonB-dependent receptor [Bacteroidetes bacterium]|nr:TonB-dependent receptor [Bacteroidota bacterium]
MIRNFFFAAVLSLICLTASAQTGDIRGFVYEQENSEPSPYVSVYLKGTQMVAQTNLDGFFSISKIPPGNYDVMVTSVGFDTISQPITISKGDFINKKFFLKKSVILFREVEVSAEKEEKKTEVLISVTKISPKDIRQVPTIGGEPDLAQYLQILPGIVTSGDQGGQLYIRGGSPIQNKVLLDGMVIYNPFHSIGFFSVFDPDIIRGVDVYTGGFNAEYGGRISSIMDVTTRDGNKKRISGKVSATTFTSKAIIEGPLKKQDDAGGGSSSFLFQGKTSYLDKTSKSLYAYVDSAGLPFTFNDLYGKVSFNGSNGSKVNFFGFRFADKVDYQNIANLHWENIGFGSNFVVIPGANAVLIEGNFAYSKYNISLEENDGLPRTSEIKGFNGGLNFTYFFGKDDFKYGFEVLGTRTDYSLINSVKLKISDSQNTSDIGGFLKYKKVVAGLVIEPGIRINYYPSFPEFSFEPRLGLKYNITDFLRFKAAGGEYSQNLLAATSDRDVVNLFYGFLTGSNELPEEFNGQKITTKLQKAEHAVAGFEIDLPKHLALNLEGYFKNFRQIENVNRDKVFEDNNSNYAVPDLLKKDFIIETGKAYGVEALLTYDRKDLYIWVAYTLSWVTRNTGTQEYYPFFDRRHNLNVVTAYKFGKKKLWEANIRWNLGSPFPFTRTQGFYEQLVFDNGVGTDINHQNGNLAIYYDDLNKGRLSYYHRLDFSVKRGFQVSKNSRLEATVSVTNAYDRENIFYVNRVTNERVYQLPVLPSFGMSLTF